MKFSFSYRKSFPASLYGRASARSWRLARFWGHERPRHHAAVRAAFKKSEEDLREPLGARRASDHTDKRSRSGQCHRADPIFKRARIENGGLLAALKRLVFCNLDLKTG